jgi:four helix bundle protein
LRENVRVSTVRDYRDLIVWQKAMVLAEEAHALARGFPRLQAGKLAEQLRRASTSVPLNIAEGNGRRARAEYLQHLAVARGSLMEVQTILELAQRLHFADATKARAALGLCDEISRMLTRLRQRLGG